MIDNALAARVHQNVISFISNLIILLLVLKVDMIKIIDV